MRTIGVVTSSRADYGIYLPVLRAITQEPDLNLRLYVTGMHLVPEFGFSVELIESDGFLIAEKIEGLLAADSPSAIGKSMGLTTLGFSQSFQRERPDILLVLGDRFEMFAAVAATLPFKIPVAHIHGGELTEGAIDDSIRHSITKMSHIHFPTTAIYAERIVQMGEEPWRVKVSGAPSLDNLHGFKPLTAEDIKKRFGLYLTKPFILATFHPVTLEYEKTTEHIQTLLEAIHESEMNVIFTYPNADTQGRSIISHIEEFRNRSERVQVAKNLGTEGYFSLMSQASVMVGNSSSGIIEAASFSLPVVNVGKRQLGRFHGCNVLDVPCQKKPVLAAIRKALSSEFLKQIADADNPYGQGHASKKIVETLKKIVINDKLLIKKFYDVENKS